MIENFESSLKLVLKHEGGFSNHPRDPGGATMKGVTQRVYDAFRDRVGKERQSVANISNEELRYIYRKQYWDAVQGDDLPAGIDYVVFDGAVNSGPVQSAKWLQRALGCAPDGHVGQATLALAQEYPDHDELVNAICDQRLAFLKSLRTWDAFGKGWSRRVSEVRTVGTAWAEDNRVPADTFETVAAPGKADSTDVKITATETGDLAAKTGAGVTVTAATEALEKLTPYSHTFRIIGYVVLGLTLIVVGYSLYKIWRKRDGVDS